MNRSMWNAGVETIGEAEQAAMERNKLVRQIDYVYSESPFYRSKLDGAGLALAMFEVPRTSRVCPSPRRRSCVSLKNANRHSVTTWLPPASW